jgi:hypothetical protein
MAIIKHRIEVAGLTRPASRSFSSLLDPVEYREPISSQATTSPIRQDQVPQRLFLRASRNFFALLAFF